MQSLESHQPSTLTRSVLTIGLCFLVALLEGLDLQSAGIAAPGISAEFGLTPAQLGTVFSASILGLLPGSLFGGRLADSIGRKTVLLVSIALFGVFSLGTALSTDYHTLLLCRFLTGVGLGAAVPNLVTLVAECVAQHLRGRAVSLMFCGMPLGGALASLCGVGQWLPDWQAVFYIGGIAPLLLLPVLFWFLPESKAFRLSQQAPTTANQGLSFGALFHKGQTPVTLLMWLTYFFTLLVIYILMNWLPSLLQGQGFSRTEAVTVQIAFSIGAALGSVVLGNLFDRWKAFTVVALMYVGILAALAGLGMASDLRAMLLAGFSAGFFTIGSQLVLYALTTLLYPTPIRATGLGCAVAVGRLGAMTGPIVAGQLLAVGFSSSGIMAAAAPCIVIATAAAFCMLGKNHARKAVTA